MFWKTRGYKPGGRKLTFMTTMVCSDCNCFYDASCTSHPCPFCGSTLVVPASKWAPDENGLEKLGLKKAVCDG